MIINIKSFNPEYVIPAHLLPVCLQVLGIFFGSKTSKYLYKSRADRMEVESARQRAVLELIRANEQITRQDVERELKISSATAGRFLSAMEESGLIKKIGKGKGTCYVAADKRDNPEEDP